MRPRIHLVAGARPNFMKVGPVYHALATAGWAVPLIVHTGQHFSAEMSDVFIRDLRLPEPHLHLGAVGATHATQTAAVMTAYEAACLRERPDWTVVVGDVNSTLGACLAATKLQIPVAHLEAGLRSGDRRMPEEINRLAVDAIADVHWTPSADADANLAREGVPATRIDRVGNVMIDAYHLMSAAITAADMPSVVGVTPGRYVVVTLHRPANVDSRAALAATVEQLVAVQREIPLVFPVHPRTKDRLEHYGLWTRLAGAGAKMLPPLGYVEFMSLVAACAAVITDSGGVQEETTYLGVPCLTARESTERPITVTHGTNRLVAADEIAVATADVLARPRLRPVIPLWDGRAADRVVASLKRRVGVTD